MEHDYAFPIALALVFMGMGITILFILCQIMQTIIGELKAIRTALMEPESDPFRVQLAPEAIELAESKEYIVNKLKTINALLENIITYVDAIDEEDEQP